MSKAPIIVTRIFQATPKKIWKALTDKTEMKSWYFGLPEFRAEPGFKFDFTGSHEDGVQYKHLCEVTEVIPGKKLTYSWRYEGYAGNSFVTFELIPQGDNTTLLRLTHTGLETFPQDNPDLAPHNFAAGWDSIINTSLKAFLEGEING